MLLLLQMMSKFFTELGMRFVFSGRKRWSDVFPDVDSQQRLVIQEIQSTWFLVSIVDNDYVGGDLFSKLTCLTSSL